MVKPPVNLVEGPLLWTAGTEGRTCVSHESITEKRKK